MRNDVWPDFIVAQYFSSSYHYIALKFNLQAI